MNTIYTVTEIKTVADGSAVIFTNTQHLSRNSAESVYYSKLAAAANPDNTFPRHGAILMTNSGLIIDCKFYDRTRPDEPETELTPNSLISE